MGPSIVIEWRSRDDSPSNEGFATRVGLWHCSKMRITQSETT
jgi:hypothetical protein